MGLTFHNEAGMHRPILPTNEFPLMAYRGVWYWQQKVDIIIIRWGNSKLKEMAGHEQVHYPLYPWNFSVDSLKVFLNGALYIRKIVHCSSIVGRRRKIRVFVHADDEPTCSFLMKLNAK